MIADAVYALCALTSLLCTALLWRSYRRDGVRLVLWCAICFGGLFLNNVLLIVDLRFLPTIDLSAWRVLPAVVGVAALLIGLVWDAGR